MLHHIIVRPIGNPVESSRSVQPSSLPGSRYSAGLVLQHVQPWCFLGKVWTTHERTATRWEWHAEEQMILIKGSNATATLPHSCIQLGSESQGHTKQLAAATLASLGTAGQQKSCTCCKLPIRIWTVGPRRVSTFARHLHLLGCSIDSNCEQPLGCSARYAQA